MNGLNSSGVSHGVPLADIGEDDEVVQEVPPGARADGDDGDHEINYDQDFELNPDRISRARRFSSIKLSDDELGRLQDIQRRIASQENLNALVSAVQHNAEEEEKKRSRVTHLRRKMLDAQRRARTEKDDASGTLLTSSVKRGMGLMNSLLVTSRMGSWNFGDWEEGGDEGGGISMDDDGDGEDGDGDGDGDGASSSRRPHHDALYERRCNSFKLVANHQSFNCEDYSYVRKPNLARLVERREDEEKKEEESRPKFSLRNILTSRRFHLYKHRFANAQYKHELRYPTLPQPRLGVDNARTEMVKSRAGGHRFIITADTQFGILMDGFAMENPNWNNEIEISRHCVEKINAMKGPDRPLFVSMCGDLVDTESSFSKALASWKKIMSGWERNLVFDQQVRDFKRVWGMLDDDIALVCLCGNHDVGNRPTRTSIEHWTSSFGDDYLAFWVNGTYNICLNNCLFSDPTGAPDLFEEQLVWLEERLIHANQNNATHIFVYSHFPWFLKHEEETDDEVSSYSDAPPGWGPSGTKFPDNYFTIPLEERQMALMLFRKYNVTACFSGHFHQNVVAKTKWGMDMIVTGPLSMPLKSTIQESLSDEPSGVGMRVVDVGEDGKFKHEWVPFDMDYCQECANGGE